MFCSTISLVCAVAINGLIVQFVHIKSIIAVSPGDGDESLESSTWSSCSYNSLTLLALFHPPIPNLHPVVFGRLSYEYIGLHIRSVDSCRCLQHLRLGGCDVI